MKLGIDPRRRRVGVEGEPLSEEDLNVSGEGGEGGEGGGDGGDEGMRRGRRRRVLQPVVNGLAGGGGMRRSGVRKVGLGMDAVVGSERVPHPRAAHEFREEWMTSFRASAERNARVMSAMEEREDAERRKKAEAEAREYARSLQVARRRLEAERRELEAEKRRIAVKARREKEKQIQESRSPLRGRDDRPPWQEPDLHPTDLERVGGGRKK